MPARQVITIRSTKTTTRTRTKAKKNNSGKKKGGNQKRCPACGRYM